MKTIWNVIAVLIAALFLGSASTAHATCATQSCGGDPWYNSCRYAWSGTCSSCCNDIYTSRTQACQLPPQGYCPNEAAASDCFNCIGEKYDACLTSCSLDGYQCVPGVDPGCGTSG